MKTARCAWDLRVLVFLFSALMVQRGYSACFEGEATGPLGKAFSPREGAGASYEVAPREVVKWMARVRALKTSGNACFKVQEDSVRTKRRTFVGRCDETVAVLSPEGGVRAFPDFWQERAEQSPRRKRIRGALAAVLHGLSLDELERLSFHDMRCTEEPALEGWLKKAFFVRDGQLEDLLNRGVIQLYWAR